MLDISEAEVVTCDDGKKILIACVFAGHEARNELEQWLKEHAPTTQREWKNATWKPGYQFTLLGVPEEYIFRLTYDV